MTRIFARFCPVFLLLLAVPSSAAAGGSWSDRFYLNGPDGEVSALLVHDGALYAGGEFSSIGPTFSRGIARFDGSEWSALGGGIDGNVRALVEYGADLIAAGSFQGAGDATARNIARWDGASWHPLGDGVTPSVRAVATFNGDLVAGTAGYYEGDAARVMRWDGTEWTQMGDVFVWGDIVSLAVYRGELFAACFGVLTVDSRDRYAFVWRWEGSAWAPLTTCHPIPQFEYGPDITMLQVVGDRMYAGGTNLCLDDLHGDPLGALCFWDGTGWNDLPGGWSNDWTFGSQRPEAILPYGDGVIVAGCFWGPGGNRSHSIALYDGSAWVPMPAGGLDNDPITLADPPRANAMAEYQGHVYVAGHFGRAGAVLARSIARWDGSAWGEVATGGQGIDGGVRALAYWDGRLVAGGLFIRAGGRVMNNVAVLERGRWEPLASGLNGYVSALTTYGDGIVAAGVFTEAGGLPASGIASWDGSAWRALGPGLQDGFVAALTVYNGALIAGGRFERAGEMRARFVARWDGTSWEPMGSDLDGTVLALEVHDGILYAAGDFTSHVTEWDGAHWWGVARDFGRRMSELRSTPEGLYAGDFLDLWRWEGENWSQIEVPEGTIGCLGMHKGNLICGGSFRMPGYPSQRGLIRFKDGAWTPIQGSPRNGVSSIATNELDLAVGGSFTSTGDVSAWGVALWEEVESPMAPRRFTAFRSGASVGVVCEMMDGAESLSYLLYREDPGYERALLTATPLSGRRDYAFSDSTARLGAADYWMEQVSYTGDHMAWFGPAHLPSTSELWPLRDVRAVPNPAWGPVSFSFNLPAPFRARIEVFDPSGRTVATLRSGFIGPGPCTVEWDGRGAGGRRLAAGVYWMRLQAGRELRTARFVRVR